MSEENSQDKEINNDNNSNNKDNKEDKEIQIIANHEEKEEEKEEKKEKEEKETKEEKEEKEKENNMQKEDNKYNGEILNVENEFSEYDINFKIIVIGNSGVGKTCITNQATKNVFTNKYQATIGMEIFSLYVKLKDKNKIIKLQIWDTCGQEIYRSLITNFYRSSSMAILVYSIDQKETFKDIDLWLKELKMNNSPDTKIMLVGNKLDLEEKREVQYEEAKKFSDDFDFCDFFETSAKTGENIKKMFIKAATILYDENSKFKDNETDSSYSTFKPSLGKILRSNKTRKEKKDICC